jgi:hypothetical protein
MSAQRSGDLLHRLDAGSHGLLAPEIPEHAGPGRRVVFPELLPHSLGKLPEPELTHEFF